MTVRALVVGVGLVWGCETFEDRATGLGAEPTGNVGEGFDPGTRARFQGEAISFSLVEGSLAEVDVELTCACEGVPNVLRGRLNLGDERVAEDGHLPEIKVPAAALGVEGRLIDLGHASGTYDFACCQDVAWTAAKTSTAPVSGAGCQGTPPLSPVPVTQTEQGRTFHWAAPESCIGLSVGLAVSDQTSAITLAAQGWTDIDCSPICFELVTDTEAPMGRLDRRVHFDAPSDVRPLNPGSTASAFVNRDPETGTLFSAVIVLSADTTQAELSRQLGRTLGFDQATDDADSVLSAQSSASMPTDMDRDALCALYGPTPWCGAARP